MKKYFSITGLVFALLGGVAVYLLASSTNSESLSGFSQILLSIIGIPFIFPAAILGSWSSNIIVVTLINSISFYFIGLLLEKIYSFQKWVGLILSSLYISGFIAYILFLLFAAK